MKYLETFKLFENNYNNGDVVTIRYWLTGDIVPVKIISSPSKNQYIVSFQTANNPLPSAPNLTIKKQDIVGNYDLTSDPLAYRNPMNIPAEKPSNDMVISGYPKTLA